MDDTAEPSKEPPCDQGLRSRRNRSVKSAISTSLASKVSTAVLQLASLPVAARVLGREEFGIYATVSTVIVAVAMLQLGVGPALAKGISEASAEDDKKREASFYRTGAVLIGLLILGGFGIVSCVLTFTPITILFGETYAPWQSQMTSALWCGAILMAGQLLVAHTDRVREGYMEAASVNASSGLGNLCSALIVALGISHFPSVEFLLLSIFLPNIIARLVNTALLLRKRPYLISTPGGFSREIMKILIRDGISFTATSFVVFMVEFGVCALLVGRWLGPSEVALFHVLKALRTAFLGFLKMVGTPVWAALIDARKQDDQDWTQTAIRRYRFYLLTLSAAAGVVLIALGSYLLPLWYGEEFGASRLIFAALAAFLFATGWRFIHRTIAIGLGQLSETVRPILFGLAAELTLAVIGLNWLGLAGLFFGLALGIFLVPGWILPMKIHRETNGPAHSDSGPSSRGKPEPPLGRKQPSTSSV